MAWLALFQRVLSYLHRRWPKVRHLPKDQPPPPPPPPPEPEESPPPAKPVSPAARERLRRQLERARRRYDVFVEPKDARPPKVIVRTEPKPRKPKVKPVEVEEPAGTIEDTHQFYAQETSRGDHVLVEETEVYGEFNFRDTILDQLDKYFVYLRRMRKREPDAWGFYKQVGITLVPLASNGMTQLQFMGEEEGDEGYLDMFKTVPQMLELPPWFKVNRPSFGCVAFGTSSVLEKAEQDYMKKATGKWRVYHPRFFYFRKYSKPPPAVQLANGSDVYSLTMFWDRVDETGKPPDKTGTPENCFFSINKDGRTQLLKVLESAVVKIRGKRIRRNGRRGRKNPGAEFEQSSWVFPAHLVKWAKSKGVPVEDFLINMFCNTVKHCEYATYSMVRVAVTKGDMVATFGVAIKRIGYFFQDRDIQLNEGGTKRRIFHLVRAHKRVNGDREVIVPFHFRGLREFVWAGYQVKITVPGRDHFMIPEFNVPAVDEYWDDKTEPTIHEPEMGEQLVKWMNEGVGGIHKTWKEADLTVGKSRPGCR